MSDVTCVPRELLDPAALLRLRCGQSLHCLKSAVIVGLQAPLQSSHTISHSCDRSLDFPSDNISDGLQAGIRYSPFAQG